ncbi:MAG: MinD/ParA family protein [Planctomycetes bacterium]|nr:MinD/ParA family protein [Planctomycetota bacterium]
MPDQAQILRGMMERRTEFAAGTSTAIDRRARTIAITSGKGGVGKSVIALNLAVALQKMGQRTCLLDANLGLGNIDLLCGLNGYWNLSHVVSGARTLSEIVLQGPQGIHVVPGASGLFESADCPASVQREIISQLEKLERDHEFLIIDTGTGIHKTIRQFVSAADIALVVTTPEPTAIADAYATLKALFAGDGALQPHLLVNQSQSPEQAREIIARVQQTARTFLHLAVSSAGHIPRDPAVPEAVWRRSPFTADGVRSAASLAIEQLARRILNLSQTDSNRGTYFGQFALEQEHKTAC